ncbi:MAG TPA: hypothetical protein VFE46_16530 [Pirellulales bacterium]|jgi:ppGpp synthetase/RelA/SpoT-type nucleotidyltranferase|nr:hypothetical protein [Pirellulales bacterium]
MAKTTYTPNVAERKRISDCVNLFKRERHDFERFAEVLHGDIATAPGLVPFIKFAKHRVKDPSHLREKLRRKCIECKRGGKHFDITATNLFSRITDLAGVRVLHLHTDQMRAIHPQLLALFKLQKYELLEGPIANLWDHEYETFFSSIGIKCNVRVDTMYTSVHYVVRANTTTETACELQVRTLSEELWGEVSHKLNYPKRTTSVACNEQLKVLARLTSSATRLVDSIFKSYDDHCK